MEQASIWSPDGETIIFDSTRSGPGDLFRKKSNGAGAEELLYSDNLTKIPTSWSPDGRFLLFQTTSDKTGSDIWVLSDPLGSPGAAKPYPFLQTRFNELVARFSPDGKWVAYQSDESGHYEIYVAPFLGPGGKRQISAGGGRYPRWRSDGREIFYVNPGGELMATEVSATKDQLDVGKTAALFGGIPVGSGQPYDVTADGNRFIALVTPEQGSTASLTLVQNWPALLRK
jgi:Tol biopolymer transport system component